MHVYTPIRNSTAPYLNPSCLSSRLYTLRQLIKQKMVDESVNSKAISPWKELLAYEEMWKDSHTTVKAISDTFKKMKGALPSDFVLNISSNTSTLSNYLREVVLENKMPYNIDFIVEGAFDYPERINDARHKIPAFYYAGNLSFLNTPSIAVVGTRKPSPEGKIRAARIATLLAKDGITVVSGLAEGIDTEAHVAAIKAGGRTIGVIGTPLNTFYPKFNERLQTFIGVKHLLVSQVPFYHYANTHFLAQRNFFPERNKLMSALTQATIIIEASDTSGTLVQARAALEQGRKLFILDSCFQNPKVKWPAKFECKPGVFRVKNYQDIKDNL